MWAYGRCMHMWEHLNDFTHVREFSLTGEWKKTNALINFKARRSWNCKVTSSVCILRNYRNYRGRSRYKRRQVALRFLAAQRRHVASGPAGGFQWHLLQTIPLMAETLQSPSQLTLALPSILCATLTLTLFSTLLPSYSLKLVLKFVQEDKFRQCLFLLIRNVEFQFEVSTYWVWC